METIKFEKIKRELKWKNFKDKCANFAYDSSEFIRDHKEELAVVVPLAALGIKEIGKISISISKERAKKAEQLWKDTHYYDHSLGQYIEIKRPLKKDELIELLKRRKLNNEGLGEALLNMNMVKR